MDTPNAGGALLNLRLPMKKTKKKDLKWFYEKIINSFEWNINILSKAKWNKIN